MKMTEFLFERMVELFATVSTADWATADAEWYWMPYNTAFTPSLGFAPDVANYSNWINWVDLTGTPPWQLVEQLPTWAYEIGTSRYLVDWAMEQAFSDMGFITDAADVFGQTIHGWLFGDGVAFGSGIIHGSMLNPGGPITPDAEEQWVEVPKCRFYFDPAFQD